MLSHSEIILKCLHAAFDTKYSLAKLSSAELAALIRLQHSLWWQRIVLSYLLDDYSDRFDVLEKKCRPAINEALKRPVSSPALLLSLLPIPKHFPSYSKKIEKLFVGYIQDSLSLPALSSDQEMAFVAIYAHLRHLHLTAHASDYEITLGKEKAQAIVDQWISSFDPSMGWGALPLRDCLARLQCIRDFNVRRSLSIDWKKADAIFQHYLRDIADYDAPCYCQALALRAFDIDKAELPYADQDLHKSCALLLHSPHFATRLMAAHAILGIFTTLYLEEATALASLPQTTRDAYIALVKAENFTSMSAPDLLNAAMHASSVIDTLYTLEDDCGFYVHNLTISKTARHLSSELTSRHQKVQRLKD